VRDCLYLASLGSREVRIDWNGRLKSLLLEEDGRVEELGKSKAARHLQ
jgi:hypothetical protein